MKNLKKVLAFVTVLTMLLSVSAFAGTTFPDVDDNASYAEAVTTLNSLGIMEGNDEGNFLPDDNIKRSEAAAVILRMKNLGSAAEGAKGTPAFNDVAKDHWALGYINLAAQNGIVNGMGDGNFAPEENVTYEQIIKMIVVALGYEPKAQANGGYPTGYLVVASQESITKGVTVTSAAAPRWAVARLVFNALEVPLMVQTGFKAGEEEYTVYDGSGNLALKTLLSNDLKVDKFEGVLSDTYFTSGTKSDDDFIKIDVTAVNGDKEADDVGTTLSFVEGDENATGLLGNTVVAYATEDEETGDPTLTGISAKAGKNETVEIDYSQIDAINPTELDGNADLTKIEYYKADSDSTTTKMDIAPNAKFFYNGRPDGNNLVAEFLSDIVAEERVFGKVTLIDNDNDEEYEYVMVTKYTADYLVKTVNASAKSLEDKNGSIDIEVEDENFITRFFMADGTPATFEDIQEGDVLTTVVSVDNVLTVVYISRSTVEGVVSELNPSSNGDNGYKVEGTVYKLAYDEGGSALISVNVGDECKFYMNVDNRIVAKDIKSSNSSNYAYLQAAAVTSSIGGATLEMKFLTTDNGWQTLEVASKVTVVCDGENRTIDSVPKTDGVVSASAIDGDAAALYSVTKDGVDYEVAINQGVFQYATNSSGKINRLYVLGAVDNDDSIFSMDASAEEKAYSGKNNKIGNIYFNDESRVFSVKTAKGVVAEEDDILLTKVSTLFVDGSLYTVDSYDIEGGYPNITVAYEATGDILVDTKVLLVTRVSETNNANGVKITKIYGYQDGIEVSGEQSEDGWEVTDRTGAEVPSTVAVGDVVIFALDAAGCVDKVQVLMTNAEAAAIAAGDADTFYESNDDDGYTADIFGFVQEKAANSTLCLAENWTADAPALADLDGDDAKVRIANTVTNKVAVYEVNLNRATPTYQVFSYAKIDAQTKASTETLTRDGHWAYVRMYDGSVVDVVVYRLANPVPEA